MPSYIDLHTHTNASDGALTPFELICAAKNAGISTIAITDHDTIDGLEEGIKAGYDMGISVIPGVELSADYPKEMHILGLYIDYRDEALVKGLEWLGAHRAQRNEKMIESLISQGVDITLEEVLATKNGGSIADIGRAHLAVLLVSKGYADNLNHAFDKFLRSGSPAYIPRQRLEPRECIDVIKAAKGYTFLAHPLFSESDPYKLEELLLKLKNMGLDGVECFHSSHDYEFTQLCIGLCEKHGFMISGGSDFHGSNKPHVEMGQVLDGLYIEEQILTDIRQKIGKV